MDKKEGYKDSSGKIMMNEVDANFILEMGRVMSSYKKEQGGKYERGNHYKTIDPIELLEACERHLLKVKSAIQNNKSIIDSDGFSHVIKVSTNAMMLFIQLERINGE